MTTSKCILQVSIVFTFSYLMEYPFSYLTICS